MKKTVDINFELEPKDCIEFLKEKNSHVQLVFLCQLAKLHYQHPYEFNMQLADIKDELNGLSHDTRNMIYRFIDEFYEQMKR